VERLVIAGRAITDAGLANVAHLTLEHQALYEQFHLDAPWDGPHNKILISKMPAVYRSPMSEDPADTTTYYQVFVARVKIPPPADATGWYGRDGRDPAFVLLDAASSHSPDFLESQPRFKSGPRESDIQDGTSNTCLVAEASTPVPWTKPADIEYDPEKPLPELGGLSNHGFVVVLFDGSVEHIPADMSEDIIRAAITHQGQEEPYFGG